MLKENARQFLYKPLSLGFRKRIAVSLLYDVMRSASRDDVNQLADAFAVIDHLQLLIEDRIRHLRHSGRTVLSRREPMQKWVMDEKALWVAVPTDTIVMPGMISDEEAQYYDYIGTLYEGSGEAIELGSWLGKSTRHIPRGLRKNPNSASKKLHVFDDFIWRTSWMDQHVPEHLRFSNHANFRALFEKFVADILPDLAVSTAKICNYEGNEHLPRIKWDGRPIEIMYIDCGRTKCSHRALFPI
jgi:hypothetical protein